MKRLSNRGFAITTVIYSLLFLLSSTMFLVFSILRNEYNTEKTFFEDIKDDMNYCLTNNTCKGITRGENNG